MKIRLLVISSFIVKHHSCSSVVFCLVWLIMIVRMEISCSWLCLLSEYFPLSIHLIRVIVISRHSSQPCTGISHIDIRVFINQILGKLLPPRLIILFQELMNLSHLSRLVITKQLLQNLSVLVKRIKQTLRLLLNHLIIPLITLEKVKTINGIVVTTGV